MEKYPLWIIFAECATCGRTLTERSSKLPRCLARRKPCMRYERGANELPIRHLIVLCRYYGVSADYLLGLSDEPGSHCPCARRGKP